MPALLCWALLVKAGTIGWKSGRHINEGKGEISWEFEWMANDALMASHTTDFVQASLKLGAVYHTAVLTQEINM